MLILAVDTAFGQESCAILRYGEVISYSQGKGDSLQAEKLFDNITAALADAKVSFDNIDYFVADIGPGSFTGIRIGVSAVMGLASAQNKKFLWVSSLEALAYKINVANITSVSVAINAGREKPIIVSLNLKVSYSRLLSPLNLCIQIE